MLKHVLVACVILLACVAWRHALSQDHAPSALYIVRHLDMLSFPNSIRPRRQPGLRTLQDYGVDQWTQDGLKKVNAKEHDGGWIFSFVLLKSSPTSAVFCFTDESTRSSYFYQGTLEVRAGKGQLFQGTIKPMADVRCAEYRNRSGQAVTLRDSV